MNWEAYEVASKKGPWPIFIKLLITIVPMLVILFVVNMAFKIPGLEWMRFYETKKQNIQREIFENTQSFTHGKIQDLAKYFDEYRKAEPEEQEAIRGLILMHFAQFDAQKINSPKLRNFLITTRGF